MISAIPATYEQARSQFQRSLDTIQSRWADAHAGAYGLSQHPDLTIDWIATTLPRPRLLVITTGEHGIEAYAGAFVLDMLVNEFLQRLDPSTTGLLLVHAINPWGMKHRRRVNPQNVDLNRNFFLDAPQHLPGLNPDYARLDSLLNPPRKLQSWGRSWAEFLVGAGQKMGSMGLPRLRSAILSGQYARPAGIYFGGASAQEETRQVISLYRRHFSQVGHVLHLDLHTGYGPRARMLLVNSPLETRSPASLAHEFDYPLVVAATPQQFYAIHGDMIDYVYHISQSEFPGQRLYAAAFEFGTLGDGIANNLRDIHAMVTENQSFHYGAVSAVHTVARNDFEELYLPSDPAWRTAILADARRAAAGILITEGFLT